VSDSFSDKPLRQLSGPLAVLQTSIIAVLLTLVAGYIDVVGYLSVYRVYTEHMTGNTVAMARHVPALQWSGVARHAWPIVTFLAGLVIGSIVFEAQKRKAIHQRVPATLVLESVLILIFLLVSLSSAFIPPQPTPKYYLMVVLLAVAMGIQNVTIRKVGGLNVYTTFITGSLVKFGEALSEYILWFGQQMRRDRGRHRVLRLLRATPRQAPARHMALTAALWLSYFGGALGAVAALASIQIRCVIFPLALLVAITCYATFYPTLKEIADEW
jgi:uncharacterized membrane protein YoaK (UPF0700 family)